MLQASGALSSDAKAQKYLDALRARCCVLYIRLLKRQLILLCGCSVRVVYDMTPLQRLHGRWDAWGLLVEQEDSVRVNT